MIPSTETTEIYVDTVNILDEEQEQCIIVIDGDFSYDLTSLTYSDRPYDNSDANLLNAHAHVIKEICKCIKSKGKNTHDRFSVKCFPNIGSVSNFNGNGKDVPCECKCTYKLRLTSKEEVDQFIEKYENQTGTKWNVISKKEFKTKYTASLRCQNSGKRKKSLNEIDRPHARFSNTNCCAIIKFEVKKIDPSQVAKRKRVKDRIISSYLCEFSLLGVHNHLNGGSGPTRNLPIDKDTILQLYTHYLDNLTPSEARQKVSMALQNDGREDDMQDTRHQPTLRQYYYHWDKWDSEHYGNSWEDAIEKIKRDYPPDSRIRVSYEPRVVAIVTPFMERVHKMNPQAGETMFVDTTSNTDKYHTHVTFLLCSSPFGALPLAVILSDLQDQESYRVGFDLVKQLVDGYGFFGCDHPQLIMTDDSQAERNALKDVWPDAILLLCIFHYLQVCM